MTEAYCYLYLCWMWKHYLILKVYSNVDMCMEGAYLKATQDKLHVLLCSTLTCDRINLWSSVTEQFTVFYSTADIKSMRQNL